MPDDRYLNEHGTCRNCGFKPGAANHEWCRMRLDVKALAAEADRQRDALERAGLALALARDEHPDHCGTDPCSMCVIDDAYEAVVAGLRPDLSIDDVRDLIASKP